MSQTESTRPAHLHFDLDWQAQNLISGADPAALTAALAEHALAERIVEELLFLGRMADADLEAATDYLRGRNADLERQARRRLQTMPDGSRSSLGISHQA